MEFRSHTTEENIKSWLTQENLTTKNHRKYDGFEIVDSIDGSKDENIEVSLVTIREAGQYPQHVHRESDAFFIIISGSAVLLSRKTQRSISVGDKIDVPRGTPHGFGLEDNQDLQFISIQSPPIKNSATGEEDLHLVDLI